MSPSYPSAAPPLEKPPAKQRRPKAVLISLTIAGILVVAATCAIFFFVVPKATAPASVTHWKTLTSFHGFGMLQKTGVVTVARPWKLLWTCAPQNLHGAHVDSPLIVNVYHQTGKVAETAVSTTCSAKHPMTSGQVVIQGGGHLYFNVLSQSNWTLTVEIPG